MTTQDIRYYNINTAAEDNIITAKHVFKDLHGNTVLKGLMQMAYGKKAFEAKQKQDNVNEGGLRKSKNLQQSADDRGLKARQDHRTRLNKKMAGIQRLCSNN